jgi:hypothetical protein
VVSTQSTTRYVRLVFFFFFFFCVDPETLGIRLWLLNNGNCTRSSDSQHQLLLVRSCRRAW